MPGLGSIGIGGVGAQYSGASGGDQDPAPFISGTPLRGFSLTANGLAGYPVQWQERSSAGAGWSNVSLSNPFTIGNGSGGNGAVGKQYRATVTIGGNTYASAPIGPAGISDLLLPQNNGFHSIGQDIALVNTDGVGFNAGFERGTDYRETIEYFQADMGAEARMAWMLGPGVGGVQGRVFAYMFFSRNRYTDGAAAAGYSAGVQHSNLSSQPFTWSLTEEALGGENRSLLIEYFPSDDANAVASAVNGVGGNRRQELGLLPICDVTARSYFEAAPVVSYPNYTDENGLVWLIRSKNGPGTLLSGGRYLIAMPPDGTTRMSGSFRWDRYINWLISQNATSGAWYMTGIGSGLEVITRSAGGAGAIQGKFLPSTTEFPWSGVAASAYTFDTDVAAYYARFTNLPGLEVRKAVDVFISGLKTDSLYAGLDAIYLPRAAGLVDMRREFKSASRDIIDRVGAASYIPKQGLTYAGAGYGGTQFNPATAGGGFAQDSAFLFGFIEADPGVVSASHFGNLTARFGRTTNGLGVSHRLNNAADSFAGSLALPDGYSVRRVAGAGPGGTQGSAGYQLKKATTTLTTADVAAASTALTSAEIELGRSGSGSVYSSAAFSGLAFGAGLTNVQVDAFNARFLALRTALALAGV